MYLCWSVDAKSEYAGALGYYEKIATVGEAKRNKKLSNWITNELFARLE